MKNNLVITVGRQFGSGGRAIGKLIAEMLGIAYYDNELITEAARLSGLSSDFFEMKDEKIPGSLRYALSVGFNIGTSFSSEEIYRIQSETIRKVAGEGPCVIVGRSADYVLRNNPRCFNVFVHAPIERRIKNILERDPGKDQKTVRDVITKTDKSRASYYDFYTEKQWGYSTSYHLTLDSSVLGIEGSARMIIDFVNRSGGLEG